MASVKLILKVAVIGAGAAGLCAARHLLAEPERFEFDLFEQQDDIGGTWCYKEGVGSDEFGLPTHSSIYKNLRTNVPKETMAFPDFPFPCCDGQSYVHHTHVLQYLKEYAKYYDLYKNIKFLKLVENVRPLKCANNQLEWSVSYSDLVTKEKESKMYDAVMVCSGCYSVPYVPEIPGLSDFKKLLLHSHDYRESVDFKDMKVVILGARLSGIDIGIEISSMAKEVILSHNLPPYESPLPENVRQEKGIESVTDSSVTFIDGKNYECDAIVMCTGYQYHYPFLDPSCNVHIENNRVSPLYLHMFHIDYPTLAIWAIPKMIIPFPLYDQQVRVFLKFLKGSVSLPCPEVMRAETDRDFERRLESGFKSRYAHIMPKEWQWEYDDSLCDLGKIEPIPDVVRNLFRHAVETRSNDLVNYRRYNFSLTKQSFVQYE